MSKIHWFLVNETAALLVPIRLHISTILTVWEYTKMTCHEQKYLVQQNGIPPVSHAMLCIYRKKRVVVFDTAVMTICSSLIVFLYPFLYVGGPGVEKIINRSRRSWALKPLSILSRVCIFGVLKKPDYRRKRIAPFTMNDEGIEAALCHTLQVYTPLSKQQSKVWSIRTHRLYA